ncbi:MAG: leucyl aminopeptidase family protein [Sulfuricellaceae bacterium]|nr:leucyl aminopeptidase family protein [Sulfuricellaceae bacterium]
MTVKVVFKQSLAGDKEAAKASHLLCVLSGAEDAAGVAAAPALQAALARRRMEAADLAKTPLLGSGASGGLVCWVLAAPSLSEFERQTLLRKALQALLDEQPKEIHIAVYGAEAARQAAAETAAYVAEINGRAFPSRKRKDKATVDLQKITLFGCAASPRLASLRAQAEGNWLARELTLLPANDLTPKLYRDRIRELAAEHDWLVEEYDLKRLRKMGAGAFAAVAQGSAEDGAAIVHLSYRHRAAKKTVALVGKGICFDTGGHNLKPARYMHGMHEDMNGSAVVLGILLAASRSKLPLNLDVWLALAQNHIGPHAYKQGDVVQSLNGTTIEIIHTDAEGRMVLADTLTLAAKAKPEFIIDFATLTGSMIGALGNRYSGVLGNQEYLLARAVAAGKAAGERVCAFPLDADYEEALDSAAADIKQCTLDGEADHILAARFLMRFIDKRDWLHVDLAASNCKGGLGAVAGDVTGFGVGLGLEMLKGL